MDWFTRFDNWLEDILSNLFPSPTYDRDVVTLSMNMPDVPVSNPDALLPWTTMENCRHNVRALADLEGLTVEQKNLMSQVVHCESDYGPSIVHPNIVTKTLPDGTKHTYTASTDWGIAQWNDYYHGKEISPVDAVDNPEMAIRLMCKYVKNGQIKQWVCYSSGLYLNYSP